MCITSLTENIQGKGAKTWAEKAHHLTLLWSQKAENKLSTEDMRSSRPGEKNKRIRGTAQPTSMIPMSARFSL